MNQHYDVIIVGARVAGASLAILLGEMGKKVLLVDKASFPSDTLSTHFMSHTGFLEKLGVLKKLEDSGLRKVTRMRTYIGSSFVEGPRTSYTIIPRRDKLDSMLIERALTFPSVHFKPETAARELIWEGGTVVGVTLIEHGEPHEVFGDLVVGADGKNSNLAHWTGSEKYEETKPLRPVVYGYFEGIEPLPEPATEIFLHEGRIGFVFPMEPNRDCLGIEIHPEEFKTMMKNPEESFKQTFDQMYGMKERMKGARLQGKMIGTPGMPNFFRTAYGDGWALIGDAGHSKDPSTGLGINDAFMQSFLLADACLKIDERISKEEAMKEFARKRDEQLLPGFQMTLHYVQSLRKWTDNEVALFQSMAANPMVWNKLVPNLSRHLENDAADFPLLHTAMQMEAEQFGFKKES
ncbi:NAD(P)/FAD-dependent oxidoreductase [Halobacillus trueperi]|uniref:NAD(P)/FAD-dependent oxidoreductase n=1 Tax=Halobacillus trueperi TaxID=156205 RepID=A0A3E0J9C7_9BACI|nr:NAD(P)/FAD-dependent oxidoreductase [Halobacillus trueperi]REJ09397.1 NAD(P)/FAD-dependent oxidoreductase [Halobacillus trueperi]